MELPGNAPAAYSQNERVRLYVSVELPGNAPAAYSAANTAGVIKFVPPLRLIR